MFRSLLVVFLVACANEDPKLNEDGSSGDVPTGTWVPTNSTTHNGGGNPGTGETTPYSTDPGTGTTTHTGTNPSTNTGTNPSTSLTGGTPTVPGRPEDETPPTYSTSDCPNGILATWVGGEIIAFSWDPPSVGTLVAPQDGIYDVYDLVPSESGASQTNESMFLRIPNALNASGAPETGNCNEEFVAVDVDNYGTPAAGTTLYLGTFTLVAGDNIVELSHYCSLYRAGECPQFHNAGTTCDSAGVNSVHLTGEAVCLVPVY